MVSPSLRVPPSLSLSCSLPGEQNMQTQQAAPLFSPPFLCFPFQGINITLGLLCFLPIPNGGHVGCFQIFLITNNAAVNIFLVPLCLNFCRILYLNRIAKFSDNTHLTHCQLSLQSGWTTYRATSSMRILHIPPQNLVNTRHFNFPRYI